MESTEESPEKHNIRSERAIKVTRSMDKSAAGPTSSVPLSPHTASSYRRKNRVVNSLSPDDRHKQSQSPRTPIQEKQYRLHSYAAYSGLKSNITKSFTPLDSKLYREICELNDGLNPEQHRQLDKMLEKLCIKSSSRKRKHNWFGGVNADTVREMYVKEKSAEKQSQNETKLIRRDIQRVSQTVVVVEEQIKKPAFFEYSSDRIKEFERRHQQPTKQWHIVSSNGHSSKKKHKKVILPHPIVALHNTQCQGMMRNYRSGKLDLQKTLILDEYPNERIQQPDGNNQKLKRLRHLRCLRHEIAVISSKKAKAKEELAKPFIQNLS